MSLHAQIQTEMKDALRTKDGVRLRTTRNIIAACTNEMVARGKTPHDTPSDDEVLTVIKRLAKQRKDSIEQFTAGGRSDLAEVEAEELAVLERFLPAMLTREEIRPVAEAKKAELGVTDASGAGKLVGAVMKELGGRADGADVKAVVESIL